MSGPKIVRIVTDAELAEYQARKAAVFQNLRQAIDDWKECLNDLGMLTNDKLKAVEARYQAHWQISVFERSMNRAEAEIRSLRTNMHEAKIEYRALQRQRRRRLEQAARTIATELKRTGQEVPVALQNVIETAANCLDEQFQSLQRTVNEAMPALLKGANTTKVVDEIQTEIAKALGSGLEPTQSTSNLLNQHGSKSEVKNGRLDKLLAEIELLPSTKDTQAFLGRAQKIETEQSYSQRNLLTDSLIFDLSTHCRQQREREQATAILNDIRSKLTALPGSDVEALLKEIHQALANPTLQEAEKLAVATNEFLDAACAKKYAEEKRKAILNGFAALGYDVKNGMGTAWAKNGRIVLSKKATPTVGIELASAESVDLLQMRAVAVLPKGQSRDPSQDKQIELIWCSELSTLRKQLQQAGLSSDIETALAAGSSPLKTCEPVKWMDEDEPRDERERRSKNVQQSRTV